MPLWHEDTGHRGDVDHLAAALCDHARDDRLSEEQRGPQIDALRLVPMLGADGEEVLDEHDAGVVDEDVDGAEKPEGSLPGETRPLDRAEIGLDAQAAAPLLLNDPPRRFEAGAIATSENQIGTGRGEDPGDLRPEPPGGSRDQGTLPGECDATETVRHGGDSGVRPGPSGTAIHRIVGPGKRGI